MNDSIIPDFTIPDQKPPITILREVATQLGRNTRNLVMGVVDARQLEDEAILLMFEARAVALNDYTLPLFFVRHELLQPYEAKIYLNKTPAVSNAEALHVCHTPEEFEQALKAVFRLPKVYNTIEAMLSQSRQIDIAS